jgi:hypothetical protein
MINSKVTSDVSASAVLASMGYDTTLTKSFFLFGPLTYVPFASKDINMLLHIQVNVCLPHTFYKINETLSASKLALAL